MEKNNIYGVELQITDAVCPETKICFSLDDETSDLVGIKIKVKRGGKEIKLTNDGYKDGSICMDLWQLGMVIDTLKSFYDKIDKEDWNKKIEHCG